MILTSKRLEALRDWTGEDYRVEADVTTMGLIPKLFLSDTLITTEDVEGRIKQIAREEGLMMESTEGVDELIIPVTPKE